MKVEIEDLKADKAKLESDIKEMDKLNKIHSENLIKREQENEELVKTNEKLRVQLEGSKDALKNIEYHHKEYILKLKTDHRKAMGNIDGLYNRWGMEYEDLYMKMHKLYVENIDNTAIIISYKELLKHQKDQTRKNKDLLVEQTSKFDLSKKYIEEFREENVKLENIIELNKKEIDILNNKITILSQDKEDFRKEILRLSGKVEIVVEASIEESKEKESSENNIDLNNSQEVEVFW